MSKKTPQTNLDTEIRKTVAIDLDGTLCEYDTWEGPDVFGDPIPTAISVCNSLRDAGVRVIVYTCRNNASINREYGIDNEWINTVIREWLDSNGLDYVELSTEDGKPFAHAYVDDRGIPFGKEMSSDMVLSMINGLLERH